MPSSRFSRTKLLVGDKALHHLSKSAVAVFGLGGVGSFAVESLARSGIGRIRVIDFDTIKESNFNRQLFALESTVGRKKVEVAAERIRQINPGCVVEQCDCFADAATAPGFLKHIDAAIDAIDSVSCKVALLEAGVKGGCQIVSCMGASTRLDPFSVRAGDISESSICPLAKMVRKKLRRKGVYSGIRCIYSVEPADTTKVSGDREKDGFERGRPRPSLGSISYMPALFGTIAAGEVVKLLLAMRTRN